MADDVEIEVSITLRGDRARELLVAAKERDREPAEVLADLVELVLRDGLIDAILDEGVAG